MISIIRSSTLISIMPMLMPDAEGNLENGKGLAAQAGKRRAGVGKRVDANAEPRHPVTAGDSHQTEEEDDPHAEGFGYPQQHPEIEQDDRRQ